jgi:hypothetical protein
MSTTGPLTPEQLTRGETLDEFCVGPTAALPSSSRFAVSAEEFDPEPLTDPDVTLSRHPARAIA